MSGKKILVIDDEPELVKAVEIRLRASGYEVEAAYDGPSGINKAKETKPDLILLDIIMPGMNGYQVAEKLMADPDIRIIVFSASGERDLERKCRKLGITDFIAKPFEIHDLLTIINKCLVKKS